MSKIENSVQLIFEEIWYSEHLGYNILGQSFEGSLLRVFVCFNYDYFLIITIVIQHGLICSLQKYVSVIYKILCARYLKNRIWWTLGCNEFLGQLVIVRFRLYFSYRWFILGGIPCAPRATWRWVQPPESPKFRFLPLCAWRPQMTTEAERWRRTGQRHLPWWPSWCRWRKNVPELEEVEH